jgi:uncharacterized protein YjbI with pentapeptide repeats
MANPEHLAILKQGVKVWNEWRKQFPEIRPYLDDADLSGVDLSGAYFRHTSLGRVFLEHTNLKNADLVGAMLNGSILNHADLSYALLGGAILHSVNLSHANLYHADLSYANLRSSFLSGTDFTNSHAQGTNFAELDLSEAIGLETVMHSAPSTIGIDTLYFSAGKMPEVFLRGCGLSDWQIEMAKLHQPDLSNEEITDILYRIHDLRAHQAIQISPLFISYTHTDSPFVDQLEKYLNNKGIRFWRDIHHATAGRLEKQIDRAIRLNPTLLLVLSSHSVESDWVQHETRLARKLALETKRDVLCPVALDGSWKECGWPERLREQIMEYNILDFSGWENEDAFQRAFRKLVDGLDLFYK